MTKLLVKPTLFGPRCGFRGQDVSLTPSPPLGMGSQSTEPRPQVQSVGTVLQVWSPAWQLLYHHVACGNCKSFATPRTYWTTNSGAEPSNLGFNNWNSKNPWPLAFSHFTLGYKFVFIGGFTLYDTKEQVCLLNKLFQIN